MKTLQSICSSEKPKNIEKLQKGLIETNSLPYYESMRQEVFGVNGTDYAKYSIAITQSYVCDYSSSMRILPLTSLANVYHCNMLGGQYNFEFFSIAAETIDGQRFLLGQIPRAHLQTPDTRELISKLRSYCEINRQQNPQYIRWQPANRNAQSYAQQPYTQQTMQPYTQQTMQPYAQQAQPYAQQAQPYAQQAQPYAQQQQPYAQQTQPYAQQQQPYAQQQQPYAQQAQPYAQQQSFTQQP